MLGHSRGPRGTLRCRLTTFAVTEVGDETRRIQRMDRARLAAAGGIHALRKLVTPSLRRAPEHSTILSVATFSPWRVDVEFRSVYETVRRSTLLDEMRLYELWCLSRQTGHLPGVGIEVGSWRGGAGCLVATQMARAPTPAAMYLCDTFAGVVKAGARDSDYSGGEHSDASAEQVQQLAARLGLTNVEVLEGIFPEDTGAPVADQRFRFAHIDVDVYQGAKDAFEWLWPRLVPGSVTVFDDYGYTATDGVRALVDELEGRPGLVVVRNLNGHAAVVKWTESADGRT